MNLKNLFLMILVFSASMVSAQRKLPNIIYIYADDLGYGEIGAYGQTKIKTPHLDQMAREGMLFTNHYTGAPVCAPARAMLLTGKHAGNAYIRGNFELGGFADSEERGQLPLPEGTFTIAHLMKKAGYTIGAVGKWGLGMTGNSGHPNNQGFDYFYGLLDQKQAHNYYPTHLWENEKWDTLNNPVIYVHRPLNKETATDADFNYFKGNVYAPEKMTDKALEFIDKNKDQPFFLYFPSPLPHVSLQAPDEFVKKYIGAFDESYYYGENGYSSTKYPLSTHAAMVTYLDDQVGAIIAKIKSLGLDDNTIIMFSSDNGGAWDGGIPKDTFNLNGPLRGQKRDLYEGGIRIPFIVRWPGKIKAGSTSDLISAQYDLMATFAELTKQPPVKNTDGLSFLPTLIGKPAKQEKHPFLYFEFGETGGSVAVRMGDWKGVRVNLKKNPKTPWQVYNLRSDLGETTDVATKHPDLVKKFEAIVQKEHRLSPIKEWEFINPEREK